MARPEPGALYNVCDDNPAPADEVVTFACELLGIEPPPEIPFDDAELSDPDSAITATAIGVRPRVAVVFSPEARGDVSLATLSALADPVRERLEVVQDCL